MHRPGQGPSPIELIDEKAVAATEQVSLLADGISEIDRFLKDQQLLEGKRHLTATRKKRVVSRE